MSTPSILVTGSSGFIGFHLTRLLLKEGHSVVGIDSMNDYYDVNLKAARLALLQKEPDFRFHKINLSD